MEPIRNPQEIRKIPLRSLVVEDNDDDAMLLVGLLQQHDYTVSYERVDTLPDLERALAKDWDIVFSDYAMPSMNGIQALAKVRELNADVPFIFVSGTIGEDVAVEAMRTGAQDYIMKDKLKRLLPAVRRELRDAVVRRERRRAQQQLNYLAHFDHLTGLPNRFQFIEHLKNILIANVTPNQLIAVTYIDLDRFKNINDSLGYEAGNLLLQEVSRRLMNCVGHKGMVSRLATDEFAIAFNPCLSRECIRDLVQAVFECLEQPYQIGSCSMYFSASIGIATSPNDSLDATDLLGKADIAAYRKKDDGGRGFLFFESKMAVHLEERLTLERNMRTGIENNEFQLHYQPQLDLSTGKIIGVEALIRWNSLERGAVSPANFIPLAEETGFILPLTEWILRQACQQVKLWQLANFLPIRVAVNISARQFHDDNLPNLISGILADCKLDPEHLEIEITETTIIRDCAKATKILEQIKALGIKVALDDFGTGYSSLSYLNYFKTHYLKIDQSFIRELTENQDSQAIVAAITAMAGKLSLKTIAEGVETQAQYDMLKSQGCDMVQGYFTGRPMEAYKIETLLTNQKQMAC